MGVGGWCHALAALPPGKTWYPLYRRLGGPQSRSGRVRKISPPPGFDPRTAQPVASHYTDWANLAHSSFKDLGKMFKFKKLLFNYMQSSKKGKYQNHLGNSNLLS
jgi:hypothetical protein